MAYRVRTDTQIITRTAPDGSAVTYEQAPGSLTITDAQGRRYTFQPGDSYPDWAYAICDNPRLIEIV